MNNTKTTKRALLSSALATFICIAMLIGTTFAWFTDSASTAVNKIQAGTLDVALEMKDDNGNWVNAEGETLSWKKAATAPVGEQVLWEPGCTYELLELRIVNKGKLALKYRIVVNGIVGNAKLLDVISFTYGTGIDINAEVSLAPDAKTEGIVIKGHMAESAGNEYQGLSIDGIGITVVATQLASEFDSFNNVYDWDAEYNKKSITLMGANENTLALENGKTYTVGNATVQVAENGDISYTNSGNAQTVTIYTDGGTLTVNAPNDTVHHYGEANFVNITAIAGNSFHEFGKVDVLSIVQGRVVIEKGDNVILTQVKSEEAIVSVPNNKVLKTTLQKVDGITEIQLQKGNENPITIKEGENWAKNEVPNELKNVIGVVPTQANDNYVAKIEKNFYTSLSEALSKATAGETVTMLKDYENANLSQTTNFSLKNGVTLDGGGHEIRGNACVHMCTSADGESTVNNVVFRYIHNGGQASQDDCKWYGWTEGKQGTLSAIYISGLQGTANITKCTFDNADWDAIQCTPNPGSTLNVYGNTFSHSSTTDYSQLRYIHIEGSKSRDTAATININNNRFFGTKNVKASSITNIGLWYIGIDYINAQGNYFEYDPNGTSIPTNSELSNSGSFNADCFRKLFPARTASGETVMPASFIHNKSEAYFTLQSAIEAAKSSFDYIYLLKDNDEGAIVHEGTNKLIRLYGYKLTNFVNNGTLTFPNGISTPGTATIINNGTLNFSCSESTGYKVKNNGILNLTYCSSTVAFDPNNITNTENGKVVVTPNKVNLTSTVDSSWLPAYCILVQNENGTYKSTYSDELAVEGGAVVRSAKTTATPKYYNTVQECLNNNTNAYLLKDVTENITRSGYTYLYAGNYSFTGSIQSTSALYVRSGTAVLNDLSSSSLSVGYSADAATVTVKNGNTGNITVYKNANLIIEGGTYTGTLKMTTGGNGSLVIKGGTFSSDPSTYVDTNNYNVTQNGSNWTVTAK